MAATVGEARAGNHNAGDDSGVGPDRPGSVTFRAIGTTVTLLTTDRYALPEAEAVLRQQLLELDLACSRFREGSELSVATGAFGRGPVEISPFLAQLVGAALFAARLTDGAVDPTIGQALAALGYDRDFDAVVAGNADGEACSPAALPRPAPGWRCVDLSTSPPALQAPEGVLLDLGSSAKAFAADRAARAIAAQIGAGVLVNLGGDISVAGEAPEGGWPVGLALDAGTPPGEAPCVVAVRAGGLASSGTAVRTWERAGRTLHHIVDPRTGDVARSPWALVSVAAPDCLVANAWSTAAIVEGPRAVEVVGATGLPARLVHVDGTVVTLGGWPAGPTS
ncbi:MAG TPA: FAD:protein FMN transferase [Acidimicrobiales bacterium]|nr:FAD:protein FMN transferase [Acidimicrobiales bacterium]